MTAKNALPAALSNRQKVGRVFTAGPGHPTVMIVLQVVLRSHTNVHCRVHMTKLTKDTANLVVADLCAQMATVIIGPTKQTPYAEPAARRHAR